MDFYEIANTYFKNGLSIIPVDDNKIPIGSWKKNTEILISPNSTFKNCAGIGLVCGKVSGQIEAIDIDEKYSLDGKLFNNYKKLINEKDENLLRKLTVQKTPSNGYHFIYKCKEICGNKKLANRYTTDEEKIKQPNEKVKVLIETRGENGYIKIYPSPKYSIIYGKLDNINEITSEERGILLTSAIELNQIETTYPESDSCFDDYNKRGDTISLLIKHGWQIKRDGNHVLLKRPGKSDSLWSADFTRDKNWFTVFTTSTEFESLKAYNPVSVYCLLECKNDWKEAARRLKAEGYGKTDFKSNGAKKETKPPLEIKAADTGRMMDYLISVRNNTLPMGLSTGHFDFDKYFRFKLNNFVIANGHDNTGKTIFVLWMAMQSAKQHDWSWIIYAGENNNGFIYRKLFEFYTGATIWDADIETAKIFIDNHFTLIDNEAIYSYKDMIEIGKSFCEKKKYHGFFIDPYNSLSIDKLSWGEQVHEYHYKATSEFRLFSKQYCGIWLSCHAVTAALRQKENGKLVAPMKADTEGGGKFSNRADDFLTLHRQVQSVDEYRIMEVHVRKIKETETGGRPTPYKEPVRFKMWDNNCGYDYYDEKINMETDERPF